MLQRLRCPQGHTWDSSKPAPPADAVTVCPVCGSTDTVLEAAAVPAPEQTLDGSDRMESAADDSHTLDGNGAPPAPDGTVDLPPVADSTQVLVPGAAPAGSSNDTTLLQPGAAPPPPRPATDGTILAENRPSNGSIPADGTVDLPGAAAAPDATMESADAGPESTQATVDLPGARPPRPGATGVYAPGGDDVTMAHHGGSTAGGDPDLTTDVPPTERGHLDPDASRATMAQVGPVGDGEGPAVPGYEVLGVLGRGGMGVVYKARQKGLNRVVALKMVLAGAHASAHQLARFRAEAEAVAQLHHPNIVQVYDVGEQDGCPYFSLEFIDGGSLDARTKGTPLPHREAAQLVCDLARAMDFAHRRNIIHRDLKPANVMLTAAGVPKITDFGLAKRLEGDSGQTKSGTIMGTPSYMPPEQAGGKIKELGPATDIYSLGAVLYELLTGRPPFKGATVIETLQQVQYQEPVAPSQLQPKVPRDLETICLKCLQKDVKKRYATAGALADDLQRYLTSQPILARPTPVWERVYKWARRHPSEAVAIGVAAGFLVFLAAAGFVVADRERGLRSEAVTERIKAEKSAAEARRQEGIANQNFQKAELERTRAEQNFQHAQDAVNEMLTEVGQQRLAHEPHMEKVRRDLLEKALRFYDRFLTAHGTDPAVRWQTGRSYLRVGDIRGMLGEPAAAEKAYRTAAKYLAELVAESPANTDYRRDLAVTHNNLGNALTELGRTPEAVTEYQAALGLWQRLADAAPGQAELRKQLAGGYNSLAVLLQKRNRFREAEETYGKALALQQRLAADFPAEPAYRQDVARTHNNLGDLFQATGRVPDADRAFRHARDELAALAAKHPTVPDYRQELAVSQHHLGNLLRDTKPKDAETAYGEAIRLGEALAADFPTVPAYRQELAGVTNDLGILLQAAGRQADAAKAFERSLGTKEKLAADFPRVPDFRRDLANGYGDRGNQLQIASRLKDAERVYLQALDLFAKLVADFPDAPAYQRELASNHQNYGALLQRTGRPGDAEKHYRKALELRQALAARYPTVPDYTQELAQTEINWATLLQLNGRRPEAEQAYRRAVTGLTRLTKGRNSPDDRHLLATACTNLGNLLRATGRLEEAEKCWATGITQLAGLARELPGVPMYRQELARVHTERGIARASRPADAEKEFQAAFAIQRRLVADFPGDPAYVQELANTGDNLALLLAQTNRLTEAESAYLEAIARHKELADRFPENAEYLQQLVRSQTNLAELLTAAARTRDAEAAWAEVVARREKLAAAFPRVPDFQSDLGRALNQQARVLLDRNKPGDARDRLQAAITHQKAALALRSVPRYRGLLTIHYFDLLGLLVREEHHQAAARAAAAFARDVPPGPDYRRAAGLLARCIPQAEADTKLPEPKRKELARAYADQAIGLLQKAVAAGYKDAAALQDPDFDPLRPRPDFQKLLSDLRAAK